HLEIAGVGKVHLCGQKRGRADALVPAVRDIGERSGEQRAAHAIAEAAYLALARDLLDHLERGKRALVHVVLEALLRELLVRVYPRDDEYGKPLRDAPPDERFFRSEVEDVELVDPGRNDQERALEHRLGRWRILDELHQRVLEDDLAGRERKI